MPLNPPGRVAKKAGWRDHSLTRWFGGLAGLTGALRSLRRVGEKQQNMAEARDLANTILRTQLEISPEGVLVVDERGMIVLVNRRFKEIMAVPEELLTLGQDDMVLAHVAAQVKDRADFLKKVQHLYAHPEEPSRDELVLRDGRILDRYSRPMQLPDGRYVGRIWFFRDVTERKRTEEQLRTAALTDRLTGLPNRTLLLDRLQQAIERHKRLRSIYAVLFLDLDRFKTINDSLGHRMGDQLLAAVSKRLAVELRSMDTVCRHSTNDTAARLGGDEFVILLEELAGEEDAVRVAGRLQQVLNETYILGEHEIVSTASIGIVTSACGHDLAEDVLRDADTAMYEAKLGGRGRGVVFDGAMRSRVQRKMELESGMRKGLEAKQFVVEYQPIVSLDDGRLVSLEALVRWRHPRHGLISPGEFIPLAEETGLIVPLGEWVYREACRQMAQWQRTAQGDALPAISVNLSRNQLTLPGLAERLNLLAQEAGVDPQTIHLEVTESAIMADAKLGAAVLAQLRELGFKIEMDDFGTGYSSLSCLQEFPIDGLKIDRSFVANLNRGRDYVALVHAISTLAGNLGIKVVAEGVETVEQVSILQSLECHYAQGYYYARPMPAARVMEYVARQREARGAKVQGAMAETRAK